jgi:hypothetical protein
MSEIDFNEKIRVMIFRDRQKGQWLLVDSSWIFSPEAVLLDPTSVAHDPYNPVDFVAGFFLEIKESKKKCKRV